jgi:hypothetical protein
MNLRKRLNKKHQYGSLSFLQGPRPKSHATIDLENLAKDILQSYQNQIDLQVSYNLFNETIIAANNHFYNLAYLLKHQPDFEQINFTQDDLAIYDKFLRDPKTAFGNIENEATKIELQQMSQAFPALTYAEMSPIRHYTGILYAAMNFLLKYDAAKIFPKPGESVPSPDTKGLIENLISIAAKVDPDFNPDNPTYDPYNPVFHAAAVREILLATVISISALSKPIQPELNVCLAATESDLKNNLMRIKGISLALIPSGFNYQIHMIAYGKIVNKAPVFLDINKLLSAHQKIQPDGIVLSANQFKEITQQLNTSANFSLLNDLSSTAKTKFIDILTALKNIADLLYEKIIRVDEDPKYFVSNYLPLINQTLNTNNCSHFYKVFYSSSTEEMDEFKSAGLNIITTLINPIMFGKNIELISYIYDESERLLLPNQQLTYTEMTAGLDNKNRTEIRLSGYPIRSIDSSEDHYSRDKMLAREKIINNKNHLGTSSWRGMINNFLDYLIGQAKEMICSTVIECPSYFPKHNLQYWNTSSAQTLFQLNKTHGLNSSVMLGAGKIPNFKLT